MAQRSSTGTLYQFIRLGSEPVSHTHATGAKQLGDRPNSMQILNRKGSILNIGVRIGGCYTMIFFTTGVSPVHFW